jgi:hypothetical protein
LIFEPAGAVTPKPSRTPPPTRVREDGQLPAPYISRRRGSDAISPHSQAVFRSREGDPDSGTVVATFVFYVKNYLKID